MADSAWTNQLLNLIILSAAQQGFSGFFVYSPAPGAGNLIGSWAAAAGVDPYGNAYPAGLDVAEGSFTGINLFLYSGTPAAGNLIVSAASAAGTDSFGNNYLQGVAAYASTFAAALIGGGLFFYTGSLAGGWSFTGALESDGSGDFLVTSANSVFSGNVEVLGSAGLTVGTFSQLTATGASIGNGSTAQLALNPPMATPPNAAAVAAGTATLVQLNAFCNGLYSSMKNRGMFS